jgi:large subunit ribosomal protein L10
MTREEKQQEIDNLEQTITANNVIYLSDISGINAEESTRLRRICFNKGIKLQVVKNTLLKKAFEKSGKDFEPFYITLKGNTSLMISEAGNAPAKLIKEFRKKSDRPILKGAYVDDSFYIGDDQLDALVNLKSKEELIGDIIMLLQSPAKNVISALQSAPQTIAGIVKTLSEREN